MIAGPVLFALGALPAAMLTFSRQRFGPEGPVGAHMITLPLALVQAVGLGFGVHGGLLADTVLPAAALYAALPGYVVAMLFLPILTNAPRQRFLMRAGVALALGGGALAFAGAATSTAPLALVGALGPLVVGGVGCFVVLQFFAQQARNAAAQASADAERMDRFEREQSEFQRSEWAKLPPQPELWQLIQFTHAMAPEVRAEARAKLAALPDLEGAMRDLLGTGWAKHAIDTLRDAYPLSLAPLLPALAPLYRREAKSWESSLAGPNPGSWCGNLAPWIDVAERAAKDGADVRACMTSWAHLLAGKPGLESLAARARALAGGAAP